MLAIAVTGKKIKEIEANFFIITLSPFCISVNVV
jgi:hypothetical protein